MGLGVIEGQKFSSHIFQMTSLKMPSTFGDHIGEYILEIFNLVENAEVHVSKLGFCHIFIFNAWND